MIRLKKLSFILFLLIISMSIVSCSYPTNIVDKDTVENQKHEEEFRFFEHGIYVGQIDPHSVEIKINGEPMAFQILEVKELFDLLKLKEGDKIEFTYYENKNKELIIKSINK